MASKRSYAYYLRGNQIAIIEEGLGSGVCSLSGYSNQTTCEAAGGTWTENATGTDDGIYRSPTATVTDGLEIEYAYSPRYRVNDASDILAVSAYNESSGLLSLTIANCSFTAGDAIVISGSDRWNGLHKVNATVSGATTLVLTTKYNGGAVTESFNVLQDIDGLNDEADTIDLPEYLAKALVYYVKAKMAEDQGDFDTMVYNQTQFRALMNRYENSRIWGSRRVAPGIGAIR